jgi:geranylgeranyl reductase family protein
MRPRNVDVAIIGAGPGGGMAACRLAGTGLDVVILEKENLPRHKACGGALPGNIGKTLGIDLSSIMENEVSQSRCLFNNENAIFRKNVPIFMADRSRLDAFLANQATASSEGNVELIEGFDLSAIREQPYGITVKGKAGEIVRTKLLIAADGALSKTARLLGLKQNALSGIAIDAELEVADEAYESHKNTATFNYFCLPKGYGWIFPKGQGRLSCGVGSWSKRKGLYGDMNRFLARSLPAGSIRSLRLSAKLIPFYSGHKDIATSRVCLVGDAASLVDPITGEGIRYAMQSGSLAADVVACLLGMRSLNLSSQNIPVCDFKSCWSYQQIIHHGIGKHLDDLRCYILPIFLNNPLFFYRKFIEGGQSYADLARRLAGHFAGRDVDSCDRS